MYGRRGLGPNAYGLGHGRDTREPFFAAMVSARVSLHAPHSWHLLEVSLELLWSWIPIRVQLDRSGPRVLAILETLPLTATASMRSTPIQAARGWHVGNQRRILHRVVEVALLPSPSQGNGARADDSA